MIKHDRILLENLLMIDEMKKKTIWILSAIVSAGLALVALSVSAFAQGRDNSVEYKFHKATEAFFDENDTFKAMDLLEEILDADPSHIDARYLRARIYYDREKYDACLRDLDLILGKYKGKPQVKKSTILVLKSIVFSEMERYQESVDFLRKSIRVARKDNPERMQDIKFRLGQTYYFMDDYVRSDDVYNDMLKDDPMDCAAMIGLARNLLKTENYAEALAWLSKAESYNANYSEIYRFRMQVLDKMGRTDESIDAALKYFELDEDASIGTVCEYAIKHYSYGIAKVKAMINKHDEVSWELLLASMYEEHRDYVSALGQFEKLESEHGVHPTISMSKARCYSEMGEYKDAIKEACVAIDKSDGDIDYIGSRGDMYRSMGDYASAIADYEKCMDDDPSVGYYYYAIGWCHELMGDVDTAFKFYDDGIDVDKTYWYLFLNRGEILQARGDIEAARTDFEKVLDIDDRPVSGSCRHYALHGLGRDDEAVEWLGKMIEDDPYDGGNYYDLACLYARIGDTTKSLTALETAFEKGYRKFAHIENDRDMDTLRKLPEYKSMLEHYMSMSVSVPETKEEDVNGNDIPSICEVQMKKQLGGTYEVPCHVNGLPLKFIFDTGATDVTISSVEANFMLKNDYLSAKDFKGSKQYLNASGEITEGSVICLKEVVVGDVTLKNINASVVRNQKAPLLLGESVLQKFGTFTVDNINSKLIIKH